MRFFEAVASGCLPILVGCDGAAAQFSLFAAVCVCVCCVMRSAGVVLPFEGSGVRYSDFVTRVPRSGLHLLNHVVKSLAAEGERVQRMRHAMHDAWMRVTWQRALWRRGKNRGVDAFELLLREIARRAR